MFNRMNRKRVKSPETAKSSKSSSLKSSKSSKSSLETRSAKGGDVIAVETGYGKKLHLSGAAAENGGRFVEVRDRRKTVWVPFAEFAGSGKPAFDRINQGGIVIIGSTKSISEGVARLKRFPPRPLINRVGWNGPVFALPSAEVIAPENISDPVVLFPPHPGVCDRSGTLDDWAAGVATPLADQHIAGFFIMTAFAAPLLPFTDLTFNPGFELAGAAGKGKTTLQMLTASAAGPGLDRPTGRYLLTCNATANGLETAMARHAYMPLVLEEAALYNPGASPIARANGMTELIFRLASGSAKARFGDTGQASTPFVYLMSTNQPLAALLGVRSPELADALGDRLMTIPLADDQPYGIFDHLPEGFDDGRAFAAALTTAIRHNYGVALPAFLRGVVNERAADEALFVKRVRGRMAGFRRHVGVDLNDGSASRVADAFGLVDLAGYLAKRYRVLPSSFQCREAARACYDLHRTARRSSLSPRERLVALSRRADVIDLDVVGPNDLSRHAVDAAPGFWRTNRRKEREFLLSSPSRQRHFPDWREAHHQPDFAVLIRKDKGRDERKRPIGPGGAKQWAYVFVLPGNEE